MNRRMQTDVRENLKTTSFVSTDFEHFDVISFKKNSETMMTKNRS